MKPDELKDFLRICRNAGVVPCIWGPQGIGKSQIVKQYTNDTKLQFIDLRLSLMEPGDLMGMPTIEGDQTIFKKPAWFPREGTGGVLFLDELNRANEDILQAVFQLILDRRINNHILPEQWQVVCAGNHGKDFIVNELDPALMNRFCHVQLDVDYQSWEKWASKKLDPRVVKIITENRLLQDPENTKFSVFDLGIKTTPRSWEFLNNLLVSGLSEKLAKEVAYGLVGPKDADVIIKAFLLKDYIHMSANDVLSFHIEKLNKIAKNPNVVQLVWGTNNELLNGIFQRKYNNNETTNILRYLKLLPDDVVYAFMHKLLQNTVLINNQNAFSYLESTKTNINILQELTTRFRKPPTSPPTK